MSYVSKKELVVLDGYFRASNYLSVALLYLMDNPLLREPFKISDVKPNPVGHFGTVPGQNFIYTHCNRIIKKYNLKMIYVSGPGHGGQAMISQNYLDGTYTRFFPDFTEDVEGIKKLCRHFAYPRGISSHVEANVPGSIHSGGELGYSLAHAAGVVLDNKDLIACCVVGDGEAETGPLATSWNINKFLNRKNDGVVLPILHRNGYKISNPTIFGRMSEKEINDYFSALGWKVYFVSGRDTMIMHDKMAHTMDDVIEDIKKIKKNGSGKYPMIVLTTPKGWTCPKEVDGLQVEGTFRAHQVPVPISHEEPHNLELIYKWLCSYHPEELFDENGKLRNVFREFIPTPSKCMGASVYANGGVTTKEIITPILKSYMVDIGEPGRRNRQDTTELSAYIRDLFLLNKDNDNFRAFGPDEALSNRLGHMFEATHRTWNFRTEKNDEFLSPNGRIMDAYLSEHLVEGMLEGYLLSGRYGFINSYEAFIKVVDSMIGQHAKWLKLSSEIPWRTPVPSLNILLTSHAFQQDHNGYTHQDPGFVNSILNKKNDLVRAYYPVDANTLIYTFDKCIRSKNLVNVITASKQPRPQWFGEIDAKRLVNRGIGIIDFASNEHGDADIVLAFSGDTAMTEVLGAVDILRRSIRNLKIRVVCVLDVTVLSLDFPTGLSDPDYNQIFTTDKPIIYNFHGYKSTIKDLVFERENRNISIHGYDEEGNIITPFDMRVQNEIDRFHLVLDVIEHLPRYREKAGSLKDWCNQMLKEHSRYIVKHGEDMPYIKNWKWDNDINK